MRTRLTRLLFVSLFLVGCSALAGIDLNNRFGPAQVQERSVAWDSNWGQQYNSDIKPLLESRCSVCHGCYDAPCQLKFTSIEGIERGATQKPVYDGRRLLETDPTRLFIDASSTAQWRDKGFFPVLNERQQSLAAHREAGVMHRILTLKQEHPLPTKVLLPESFTLDINRAQECPNAESFDKFAKRLPLWGMPYALPALSKSEHNTLIDWLEAGAPLPDAPPVDPAEQKLIASWETWFNPSSLKGQLVSRYIYEHLFLADVYFPELGNTKPRFFKVVRSYTPPGTPIAVIPTRRPYDDPGTDKFYYRLQPAESTVLIKTHMPYALDKARREKWQELFYRTPYPVTALPNYKLETASNPFKTFEQLPVNSRYRFMLDEAEFTIMGFIKGPVCRGQIALNVIQDHFWVFFQNPDGDYETEDAEFLSAQSKHLRLPAEVDSTLLRPLTHWLNYSKQQEKYLEAKQTNIRQLLAERAKLTLSTDFIWDGDKTNANAALTIFRHFDSASVIKGMVGEPPKTAWIISYPVLERIHYLLVAGFDVYGNVGHQLLTRLYMDFLRIESEYNFLALLPEQTQRSEWHLWYEDADDVVNNYFAKSSDLLDWETDVDYETDKPKLELYAKIRERLGENVSNRYSMNNAAVPATHQQLLQPLSQLRYPAVSLLPQISMLSVNDSSGKLHMYTIVRNNDHKNVTSLLNEKSNWRPQQDNISVARGVLGAYPDAFWHAEEDELPDLVAELANISDEDGYQQFMDRFGIRRTNPDFWQHSDRVHRYIQQHSGIEAGLLDYNRLENR